MAAYQYRVMLPGGIERQGALDAPDMRQAVVQLRRGGGVILDVRESSGRSIKASRANAKSTAAAANVLGELSVLLRAGLPLDRALTLAIGNVEPTSLARLFVPVLEQVREGRALSDALESSPALFGPTAIAMTEAGEASGHLADALARLAEMMERAQELRRLAITSMIYPIALIIIAVAVVLLMLLFVVPQFEGVMGANMDRLPAASVAMLQASRSLREQGWLLVPVLAAAFFGLKTLASRPGIGERLDAILLRLPLFGPLIQRFETARFARTLGALVEGQVSLPNAMMLAQRTIGNRHMGQAMEAIVAGVREGEGLSAPLAAAHILPDLAIGFIRTGEESSELGMMLNRLADVLDRDVRVRLERLVAILTPLITVVLAAFVTGIVASIMTAILGFNDMALAQ